VAEWEQRWEETTGRTLVEMIPTIVRGLEAAAPALVELVKQGQARAEVAHIEWERKQAIWAREEAQRRRELNRPGIPGGSIS
jgi:hypothetical protein